MPVNGYVDSRLDALVRLADNGNWDNACQWAEDNIKAVADHLDTWGPHCGAPRNVYRGQLIKMLIEIGSSNG